MIPMLSKSKPPSLLSKKTVAQLFCNIEELLKFHQNFYKELKESVNNYWKIPLSVVFEKNFGLKDKERQTSVIFMLSKYLANYEKGQNVLNSLNEEDDFIDILDVTFCYLLFFECFLVNCGTNST
jgi:hypothetical protein